MRGSQRVWLWLLLVLPATAGWGFFESLEPSIERGNQEFAQARYDQALESYRQAKPASKREREIIAYNSGLAYVAKASVSEPRREDLAVAEELLLVAAQSEDALIRSAAYLGLGNLRFRSGTFEESVDAFRRSLRSNPKNLNARYNLELAMRKLEGARSQKLPPTDPGDQLVVGDDSSGQRSESTSPGADNASPTTTDAESTGGNDQTEDGGSEEAGDPLATDDEPPEAPSAGQASQRRHDIQRKLEALERRSRELQKRRQRLRVQAGDAAVKDW